MHKLSLLSATACGFVCCTFCQATAKTTFLPDWQMADLEFQRDEPLCQDAVDKFGNKLYHKAVRLPKSLTNIAPMTTATFPNAIVPLIINTTAFLLIAATKGSRKTVMPPVTGCTLPAVTVRVRETPPSPIPEVAEARPPTTAETPVIIPINPVVIPLLMKPGALAALIPVLTAAAEHAPAVLLARLPLLPAQAARHRPPVRVLLLVPGVRAPLLQVLPALPPAAAITAHI